MYIKLKMLMTPHVNTQSMNCEDDSCALIKPQIEK